MSVWTMSAFGNLSPQVLYTVAMKKSWKTKLIHGDSHAPEGFRSLVTPTYRGSTVLFPDAESVTDQWDQHRVGYTYGLYGTPTTLELAARVCELEDGEHTIITAGGQGAISLIQLSLLNAGDHILIPENIYGPNRKLAYSVLKRFGVEVTVYPPLIGAGIAELIKDNTRLVWCESPGSLTMEVQDVPAIAKAAHARGALVVLDNTWSSGIFFRAFDHGVDVEMQALTKYVAGHSDVLLGAITIRDRAIYEKLGNTYQVLGCAPSPDDCQLALRGMKTLGVRLAQIGSSALRVAQWLAARPEIETVLHPALPSCPGHEFWERDFTGSAGLFSIVFKSGPTKQQVQAFVNALELFEIGYSWGGVASLAVNYDLSHAKGRSEYGHRIVRLYIGLEEPEELIADLEQALGKI
ncbi:cystathionine beta-lyase [Candidatus Koribacter versatilis Ellin345]|uniref:Cystathionine beta-lyase n=1 Tax=Koribacter versatilis (strain Ellin345) TaxID=204669 RepID=Q1IQ69_KORVE|nr:cystathionine beta-lyase [Candidatus Koribacter versatilis]ABF40981.1 cystathionine beta-lyase [Candidatus Koribacter versatilis Ellin345]